jgi:ABC-type transport system substrate-binding protein
MPADAAPPDQQVLVMAFDNTADFTTLDFWESVYKRGDAQADLMTEPLIRLNKNFEVVPAAATKWSVDSTNLVWTFTLDPNLMWSDDTPLTADDYVATFRYGLVLRRSHQELGRGGSRQAASGCARCQGS